MSTASPSPDQPPPWRHGTGQPPPPAGTNKFSDWAPGLVIFAGVLMLINGCIEAFRGIMAIADDDVFLSTPRYVFRFDLTGWGWIHVIIGAVVALVGTFLLLGKSWARWAGMVIVALSVLENFLALPYYPFWSVIVIAMDVFIIWALCVYHPQPAW
ncbi:hypothetical protein [Kitasatospora sp. NPDC047058]|uniref:DUF7144 family membrane protein n=1 Tax=Kitasatospora sp. NPDC047058 TaxID=3155620 RepID=UPI0034084CD4